MFKNSHGRNLNPEEPIFPLLTFDPNTNVWTCLGTGFFIHNYGGFVTAKHVFFNTDGSPVQTLYAVHTTQSQEHHLRPVKHFVPNPDADIAVGFLGKRRLGDGSDVKAEIANCFLLDTNNLAVGDEIRTFAFPLSKTEYDKQSESYEFAFEGTWADGTITDYYEEGFSLLKNKCFATTMKIESGASGGPVFRNDVVVGVNSTGFDVADGEVPLSFITPIDLIFDLSVPIRDGSKKTIKQLMEEGYL